MKHRKKYLLVMVSLLMKVSGLGQEKDYLKCQYSYFAKTRKVSASECYDNEGRWGITKAFDRAGKVIYTRNLRRVAGHGTVTYNYYASEAVKEAHWSDAPDAGIQWYRGTTYFAEDGKVTNEISDSYDGPGGRHLTVPKPAENPAPKPAETIKCAEVYRSEIWIKNTTNFEVLISAQHVNQKYDTVTLRAHQKLKVTECIGASHFEDPEKYYKFEAKARHSKKHFRLIVLPVDTKFEDVNKTVRRYYFEVRRVI